MALPDPTRIDLARSIYGRMIAEGETAAASAAVLAPQVGATPQDVRVAITYLRRGLATSEALEAWAPRPLQMYVERGLTVEQAAAAVAEHRPNVPLSAALSGENAPAYQVGVRVLMTRQMESGEIRQVSVYLPMTWSQPVSAINDYVLVAHADMNATGSKATLLDWEVVGPTRAPAPRQR